MAKIGHDGVVPAWMVCVDRLNNAKHELVTQAIETLDREVAAKRIDIRGSLINVPDRPRDVEMKLFVLGQMLKDADRVRDRYGSFITGVHAKGAGATAQEVEGAERARLFLMASEKIGILMRYSRQIDAWINDVSMKVSMDNSAAILGETANSAERKELLAFMRDNRAMRRDETFSEKERRIIGEASA